MFKSVKKSILNQKNNMEQAVLNPRPLRERVTRMCWVRGNKKQTDSITSRLSSSALNVILRRERSELSGEFRNITSILSKDANSTASRLLSGNGKWGEVLKSAVIFSVFMLFSAAAQATVCFLPDGNCGGVNYGYTDESGSTCTYKTRDEANRKKGECETVQKQGFCFYLNCSMSKSDCDKAAANAPNHDKCCVPCGNCWKVADCSIPPIETCTGAGYETEQTCKNNNQNFKPNGKFDKNGTACGECKDVPYITCPEMGDDYVTRAECTAKGSSFTFNYANVKDSDNNECGTCSEDKEPAEQNTCNQLGYKTSCSYTEKAIDVGVQGSDGQCVRCAECSSKIRNVQVDYRSYTSPKYSYNSDIQFSVNCDVNSQKNGIAGTYFGAPYFVVYSDDKNGRTYRSNQEIRTNFNVTLCRSGNFSDTVNFTSDDNYSYNFCSKLSMEIYSMLPNADIEMVKIIGKPAENCSADDFTFATNPYDSNWNLANYDQHVFTINGGEQVLSPLYTLDGYLRKPDYLTSEKFTKTMVDFSEIKTTDYEYCWSGSNLEGKKFVMVEIPVTLRKGLDYYVEVVFKLDNIQCKNGKYGRDYRGWADGSSYEFDGREYRVVTRNMLYDYPRIHLPEIDDLDAANNYEPGVYYPTLKPDEACSL